MSTDDKGGAKDGGKAADDTNKTALGGKAKDEGKGADDANKGGADDKVGEGKDGKKEEGKGTGDKGDKDGKLKGESEVPEKYDLKLPEKSPFGDSDIELFSAEAKALGLTAKQAQSMVDGRVKFASETATRFFTELKADPELGGAKLDASIALALKGRDVLFPEGSPERDVVIGWFERTGLGSHKALVRAFARLGKMAEEDSARGGGDQGQKKKDIKDPATQATTLYKGMNP